MAWAIATTVSGSTNNACVGVKNSVNGKILEVMIGKPEAIASKITNPQPSFIEGNTNTSAQR